MTSVTLVCGLPGSGKTTAALRLAADLPALRLNPDEWLDALRVNLWDDETRDRVESLQWALAEQLLGLGTSVVIEWGTWSRQQRDQLRARAHDLGARVQLCFVDADDDELWRRVAARGREDPPITRDQITEWRQVFEEPSGEELALFDHVY